MPRLRDDVNALTSPYLAQHADNPVDWYEWGDEAAARARELDRPIFLSVGYAACHWCHVMAHESFENEEIAAYLNEHFVSVKVDREERPDVDALYMAATQAVSGHGGWPMSVFLTPDGRPFMAGTYYPPVDRGGQPGFLRLLQALHAGWESQRDAVEAQADDVARAVANESQLVARLAPVSTAPAFSTLRDQLVNELLAVAQPDGGFSRAPKFPRPSYVEALLAERHRPDVDHILRTTLDAMAREGMYDHLAGGFARYSVDAAWHVPHFEKMLSDQALLALAYLHADRAYGGSTPWREVALDTLRFVARELRVPHGFAASLDADSDGHEGAHTTWTPDEVAAALRDAGLNDAYEATVRRWRLSGPETFEGRYVPRLAAEEPFQTPAALQPALDALRAARARRPQPGRDDKVILEWNAMYLVACFTADDEELESTALAVLWSLHATHRDSDGWWRTSARRARATATDLGWLLEAHLAAHGRFGDDRHLDAADQLVDELLAHYWDGPVPSASSPDVGEGVFTTSDRVTDLSWRPKEFFDGATRSAHAVVAGALARAGVVAGNERALAASRRVLALTLPLLTQHPTAVPDLVRAYGLAYDGVEVVLPGAPGELARLVRSTFVENLVVVVGDGRSPLLEGRRPGLAYVCRNNVCDQPVDTPAALRAQLDATRKGAR